MDVVDDLLKYTDDVRTDYIGKAIANTNYLLHKQFTPATSRSLHQLISSATYPVTVPL